MGYVPDETIAALRGSFRLGIFLRLATTPVIRVWLGVNDIPAGIPSIDPTTTETYLGAGWLREVPNIEALVNGVADRVEFMINGIDPDSQQIRDLETADVRGRDFHLGFTTLDDNHQPMSGIIPMISGRASFYKIARAPVQGAQNGSVTLALSVGFGPTTRDRNTPVMWSPQHQKAIYPTDKFCDNVSRLERGANPSWPRY